MCVRLTDQCIARRIPEKCKIYHQSDSPTNVTERLSRLETILESGLSECTQRMDTLYQQMSEAYNLPRPAPQPRTASYRDDARPPGSVYGSHDDDALSDDASDDESVGGKRLSPEFAHRLDGMHGKASLSALPSYCPSDVRDIQNMETIPYDVQESLAMTMYPKNVSERLVEVYLDTINLYRHPMPTSWVRDVFSAYYDGGGVVNADNITQFSLLAAVCSLSILGVAVSRPELLAELAENGHYDEMAASRNLCNAAQYACVTAQNMNKEDMHTVLTFILLSRLFVVWGRMEFAWNSTVNSVRVAFALGLHRDGKALGLDDALTERRRIVWSFVYPIERINSLSFGRPMLISDAFCDTQLPNLTDDEQPVPEELRALFANVRPPHLLLINNLRSTLARFVGELAFEAQNVNKSVSYSRILQIHVAFTRFIMNDLPFYFRIRLVGDNFVQNTHCDQHYKYIKNQRYQLWLDMNFFILSLHCPYLLRYQPRSKSKYQTSYDACLESVKLSLLQRHDLLRDESLPIRYRHSMAGLRWFNTIVVAGYILLKRPSESDASILKQHMHEFMEWRADHQGLAGQQDLNKEIDVVRSFLESAEPEERADPEPKRQKRTSTGTQKASMEKAPTTQSSRAPSPQPLAPWAGTGSFDPAIFPAITDPAALGLDAPGRAYDPSQPPHLGDNLPDLSDIYGMPMIMPNIGLNPYTLAPIWPSDPQEAAHPDQSTPLLRNPDAQKLMDLW